MATPHNSAVRLALSFPPSAACRFLGHHRTIRRCVWHCLFRHLRHADSSGTTAQFGGASGSVFSAICGTQIPRAPPHNSAVRLALSFPPYAACRFLDLPPVNLRNLHLHLTKNPFAGRPPHLCGVALDSPPVNLRNLHLHLTKNPFAGRPPHLCGVALDLPPVNLRNLHLHLTKNPFAGQPASFVRCSLRRCPRTFDLPSMRSCSAPGSSSSGSCGSRWVRRCPGCNIRAASR